ncbi:hypothetical protein CEE37_07665 [candidate division LCP-89 bacterium B3_LCP]|uniref:Uncharacterized protein n=1 Tax=candidate division LCP-89 bacterium B3_LCP TaxID=2012998 RepID=A0A532V0U5_UNCL8|nr:MAG: hypothetical protein CEE37_07665 [candidate division LCP-89 bacterium B3_LCP]
MKKKIMNHRSAVIMAIVMAFIITTAPQAKMSLPDQKKQTEEVMVLDSPDKNISKTHYLFDRIVHLIKRMVRPINEVEGGDTGFSQQGYEWGPPELPKIGISTSGGQ